MEYPFKDLLPLDEVLEREGYYKDWTHLDPKVFYSLTQISEYIKTKGFGVDVRLLIAQLAEHFGLKTTQIIDLANLLQQKFENLEGVTQSFTNNINSLVAQMQADKDAVIANVTVDSEVILARGGKATLGQRLDKEHNEVTAQLAQTKQEVTSKIAHTDGTLITTNKRIDNLIVDSGNTDAEVIDARTSLSKNKEYDTISDRLNATEANTDFVLENILENGDFEGTANWVDDITDAGSVTLSTVNNELIATGNGGNASPQFKQAIPSTTGKTLLNFEFRAENENLNRIRVFVGSQVVELAKTQHYIANRWYQFSRELDVSSADRVKVIMYYDSATIAQGKIVRFRPMTLTNLSNVFQGEMTREAKTAVENSGFFNDIKSLTKNTVVNYILMRRKTVEEFGAVGDGITDDTRAIQMALNAGGHIVFGDKTYLISKTLRIRNPFTVIIGVGSAKLKLASNHQLEPFTWRDGMPDFYPILSTNRGVNNVEIDGLDIEGSDIFTDQIQAGLSFVESKNIVVKNSKVNNINYHPDKAPARPAGQWRQGWNIVFMESENIEVSKSEFMYGGYETFRIGDNCKNVKVFDNKMAYGWRTVFQILRGSENIQVFDNEFLQDDFGTNDTHAVITLHSAIDDWIKNVTFKRNRINGKMFKDQPNGANAISFVDDYTEDIKLLFNDIESNGNGVAHRGNNPKLIGNNIKADGHGATIDTTDHLDGNMRVHDNDIKAKMIGLITYGSDMKQIDIKDNEIESEVNHAVYMHHPGAIIDKATFIKDNVLTPAPSQNAIHVTPSTIIKNASVKGNVATQGAYGFRSESIEDSIIKDNLFNRTSNGILADETKNIVNDNLLPV